MYKNLVISSGGLYLLSAIGTITRLLKLKIINNDKIENIYGTSAGGVVGLLLCLKIDWELFEEYVINRPLPDEFQLSMNNIFEYMESKGFIGREVYDVILKSVFKMKGLKYEITFRQLYEYSNIKLNVFALNFNTFKNEVFNYELTPDYPVIDAVYMSATFPFVFKPIYYNNSYYIDGGVENDYPIDECLKKCKNEETLGINIKYPKNYLSELELDISHNAIDYCIKMIRKLIELNKKTNNNKNILENEIIIRMNSIDSLMDLTSNETRRNLINLGKNSIDEYISNKYVKND
tara:strand:+ start:892 stop:1767 length:876 start_codon:yes stop_codon:yes gene_type:complete